MYHSLLFFLQDYVIYYKRRQLQKRATATFKQRDGRPLHVRKATVAKFELEGAL